MSLRYGNIRIDCPGEPVSRDCVRRCEDALGVILPESYVDFLSKANGGLPKPNALNVPEVGDTLLDVLYGIREAGEPLDLVSNQELVRAFDQLPEGWIKIGHDPGGNGFLLCTVEPRKGHVFYWDSSYFHEQSNDEDGNTYFVGSSIQQVLENLKPIDGDNH